MNIDYLIGLVLLFMVYRVIRSVLRSLQAAGDPRTKTTSGAVKGGSRALASSVPRVAARLKVAAAKPPRRVASTQSRSPFVIQRTRRFPILGLLALAALIILIIAAHAMVTGPREPARNGGQTAQIVEAIAIRLS